MAHRVTEKHRSAKYPKLHLELRSSSRYWQGRCFMDGRLHQKSTEHTELRSAMKIAEGWYQDLAKACAATPAHVRAGRDDTMQELYTRYKAMLATEEQRAQVAMRWGPIKRFWKAIRQADVGPKTFHRFYQWRRQRNKQLSNSSLHKDVCLVRQLLRYACEQGIRDSMPIVPKVGKIADNPRAWLNRAEWETLLQTAAHRFMGQPHLNARTYRQREDLYLFIIVMVGSCLRVNELRELTAGQVSIVPKQGDDLKRAQLDAVGKRGHRTVIVGGAAADFLEQRAKGLKPSERLWPHSQRDGFRELLMAAGLRHDAFGNTRNMKSLRATGISFRILAGAPSPNLLLIARQAGTSLAMIDQFYAKRLTAEMGAAELATEII